MEQSNSHYDEDSTIFSPDGRLFQVEYARETVKKGATTIGLKFKDGIILITYVQNNSKLIEQNSTNKIVKLNDFIGCTFVGLSADANHLIDFALENLAINKIWFDEQLTIKNIVKDICEYKHIFTTYYGLRPFGIILFIGGVDKSGIRLFTTDPSGAFLEYKAICEGRDSIKINKFLEDNYKDNLTQDKALTLGIKSLQNITGKKFNEKYIEIAITEKNKPFRKLSKKEISRYLKKR